MPVYLGADEIPAIYVGSEQIYPTNLGTVTGITLTNLTWVSDVPYTGGTADKDNCSYKVIAYYDSGKSRTVTKDATITGSLSVSATTAETREMVGVLQLTATYEGFTATGSVDAYQGSVIQYFTITNITDTDGVITLLKSGNTTNDIILRTKTIGGDWTTDVTYSATTTFTIPANGYVMFSGQNNPNWATDNNNRWQFSANVKHDVSGELCTLVSAGTITTVSEFVSLFRNDVNLVNASGLTINANTLTSWCLGHAFNGCTSLVSTPALTATTLGSYCYRGMFWGCTSLTTAPALSASTLAEYCYYGMFQNCSSLTTAPVLPAAILLEGSYMEMFRSCSRLNYIKCLAVDIGAQNSHVYWVQSVQTTAGTFVKKAGVTWPTGTNGIPSGWTVVDNNE